MQYEEKEENDKNKKIWILIFLLLILLLFCLYLITFGKITFGKTMDNNELIPTGNVDIFDININCSKCPICSITEGTQTVFGEVDGKLDNVIVYDENGLIDNQVNLRIFDRSAYKHDDKIAPGMFNSYQFIIRNNNSFDITYDFKMLETNIYNVNMKYRLLKNDDYVVGDDNTWVYANELKLNDIDLSAIDYHTFTLDWKWFDNDNDTYVGENAKKYRLDINVFAVKKGDN